MPYRIPLWVRALLAVDGAAARIENLRGALIDELLLGCIPHADRAALTAALYAKQPTYLPGGHRFERGLFGWEQRVLESPVFPTSGRILVGAAGAGREVVGLIDRGFEVVAFDPCERFVEAAAALAPPGRATFVQASYGDLIDGVAGRGGPLELVLKRAPFDAIILGWGSLSHVLPSTTRTSLLRALRTVAPTAPVLASFVLESSAPSGAAGKGRARDAIRRVLTWLDAPGTSEVRDHFYPHIGFFANLSYEELLQLAWSAAYEVAIFHEGPYPHALLVPLASAAAPS